MTTQEILSSSLNKTQKAIRLFDLGHTRAEVAEWITNGNYGFAYNIWKKWNETHSVIDQSTLALPFEFTFNRSFGIELEVYGTSRDAILREIRREGISIESQSYNHTTASVWKVVTDGSISGSDGNEIVSPILRGFEGMEQVKKVSIALQRAGAKINQSCGFHVHFGVNDYSTQNFKDLVSSYARLENTFDSIQPQSRRSNSNRYCKSLTSIASNNLNKTLSKINNANSITELQRSTFNTERYFKLNVQSYQRHGTIEFRHHSGTTQFSKIKNWILICGRLVEYVKQNGQTNNLNSFLNESLQDYISDRAIDLVA